MASTPSVGKVAPDGAIGNDPDKEAYDKYQEEMQKLNDLKRDREKLHDQSKRMMGIRQDVIDGENAEKVCLEQLESDPNKYFTAAWMNFKGKLRPDKGYCISGKLLKEVLEGNIKTNNI